MRNAKLEMGRSPVRSRDPRAITEQELAPALEAALRERLEDSVRQIAATRPRWPKGRGI